MSDFPIILSSRNMIDDGRHFDISCMRLSIIKSRPNPNQAGQTFDIIHDDNARDQLIEYAMKVHKPGRPSLKHMNSKLDYINEKEND